MRTVWCLVVALGFVFQADTAGSPCVGIVRYSREAMQLIFQAQKQQLQDALTSLTITPPGVKQDIKWIQIQTADIAQIAAQFIPSLGVEVSINTDLLIRANVGGNVIGLRVSADTISVVQIQQDVYASPKLGVSTCKTTVKALQVTQEANSLESLKRQIPNILTHQLCLTSSNILLGLNVQLGEFVAEIASCGGQNTSSFV
ncbi:hypothetical protein FKM82_024276 [Ascaphus truei]